MASIFIMASQFSKDGRYFAHLTAEGKLRIWETATNSFEQEYIPDFHLTSPCTCLQFVDLSRVTDKNVSPRKKKRKNSQSVSIPTIVLGTSSGRLLSYSIAKAAVEYTIDNDLNQQITCLSWNEDDTMVTGCSQHVICWNLNKRCINNKWKTGNDKVTAVFAIPDTYNLITASKNIKLWDMKSKSVLKVLTGHSYDVTMLQYIYAPNSDAYCISGSMGDRLLSCWNLSDTSNDKGAVVNFLMEDVAQSIFVHLAKDGSTNLSAVTRNGIIHLYRHTMNGKCSKPLKPKKSVRVISDSKENKSVVKPIAVYGAIIQNDLSLLISYGNTILLTFENVVLNDYEKVQCLIRQEPYSKSAQQENKSKIRTPVADKTVNYVTPHTSVGLSTTKRRNDGNMEVPMEQRLENLTLNKLDSASSVPKVNNVAQLLIQGLHSKDKAILRDVLIKQNEDVIRNTVKRLPMSVVVPLVQELAVFMQGKTVWSQSSSIWLKHVLQIHASILLSNPDLSHLLGPLIGSIENRLTLQSPLNQLHGRLELIVTQVQGASSQKSNDNNDALLVYNDKESSDSENDEIELPVHSESENDNEWIEESSDEEIEKNNEHEDMDDEDMST